MRTKHAEKACGDLWGQSMILEAISGNCLGSGGGRGVARLCCSSLSSLKTKGIANGHGLCYPTLSLLGAEGILNDHRLFYLALSPLKRQRHRE